MRRWIWLTLAGWLMGATTALAQSKADCLACHSDSSLTKEVNGKQVSVFVDEKAFGASVHSFLDCTSCHSDVKDYPHEPTLQRLSHLRTR